jgi:hypothetical protein
LPKTKQKLRLARLCNIAKDAGINIENLEHSLTESRAARRLSRTRIAKIGTRKLNRFLGTRSKKQSVTLVTQELSQVLAFAETRGLLAKNPLKHSVGEVRYFVARGSQLIAAVAVILVGSFVFQVAQRAQQTQEDPILATADVARDLGLGELVATIENLYYGQLNPAKVGGVPNVPIFANPLLGGEQSATASTNARANVPAWGAAQLPSAKPSRVHSPAKPALSFEGDWLPTKIVVNGQVAARVARIRPDAAHTSFLDTLVWFDPKLLAFQDIPGTLEPTGNFDRGNGKVPQQLAPFYMAGINGGYKTDNMHGGFIYKGKTVIPMVDGAATFLTYPDGVFDIETWGHDVIKPGFVSARQNLTPLVSKGKNLAKKDAAAKWGSTAQGTASGRIFVWRSAIGVRADGSVIHLVGPSLSTREMADLLIRAGVVRGMALDMNMGWASSYFYGPYGAGVPMDPQITHVVSRFKASSTRDFIAVYAKSPAAAAK